jgi:drug/metabolite transporter (DMT)-like permease
MASRSIVFARNKRVLADLALLLVAVIWGSTFAVQRVAAAHLGSFLYNGLRFLLAVLVFTLITRVKWRDITRREWGGGVLLGLLLAGGSVLQQAGLEHTTAGKAGFITSLYVVLVPLLLAVVWRQRAHWTAWLASLVATVGLFLLSVQGEWSLNVGDAMELAGTVLWALHVIMIGRLARQANPLRLSLVQYLACGVLTTALGLALEGETLDGLPVAWWTVVYGGVLAVGIGFTAQTMAQRVAPPTDAAIILSTESVFAALFGWLFLREMLTGRQIVGCVLMFAGMLLAQASSVLRGEQRQERFAA